MTPLEALRALGPGPEAPTEAKQRVQSALLASLESAALAASAAHNPRTKPSNAAPTASLGAGAGAASSKTVAIALSSWLLGGAMGAALYGALRAPQVQVVYVERPALSSQLSPPKPSEERTTAAPPELAAAASAATASDSAHSPRPTAPGANSELARERALLDVARACAARGEPARVLELVAQHARQFPRGRLSEEREALAIRALLALGRAQEARARAATFRSEHPNSFLMPVIDSALSAP